MSLFIAVKWFTGNGKTIGIVVRKDVINNTYKSYIGVGSGIKEQHDIKMISTFGASFPITVARQLLGMCNEKKKIRFMNRN